MARGEATPGQSWIIGIRNPDVADKVAFTLRSNGPTAVATSATCERGPHIVDPVTSLPAGNLASVTIVGPNLTMADSYATAVFVMGIDGLMWIAEHHPDYGACATTLDGQVVSTDTFATYR